jgi:hypothetical protein
MVIIMEATLILVLLAGFVGAVAFIVVLGTRSRRIDFAWEPMQTDPVPYRRRNFVFSASEHSFYKVLRTLVPDHMIFVKVRLADLVSVKTSGPSYWQHFNPINRKHIDFVVCDPTLAPVLAIELGDSLHHADARHSRDELVNSVLATALLPIIRVPERRRYMLNELRRLLSPYLRVPAPMI